MYSGKGWWTWRRYCAGCQWTRHGQLQLGLQRAQHLLHAGLPAQRQAPQHRPPQQHRVRAQRQRLRLRRQFRFRPQDAQSCESPAASHNAPRPCCAMPARPDSSVCALGQQLTPSSVLCSVRVAAGGEPAHLHRTVEACRITYRCSEPAS